MTDQVPSTRPDRMVHCARLGRDLPGLAAPPFPNELGKRIFAHISQEAWRLWLEHSKILVNEHGLRLSEPRARDFLLRECETFLFGAGTEPPRTDVPARPLTQLKRSPPARSQPTGEGPGPDESGR